jgi:hypothetical protein
MSLIKKLAFLLSLVFAMTIYGEGRVGNHGDPLELIFDSARVRANQAVLMFSPEHLSVQTASDVKDWLTKALANDREGLRLLAADIAASHHVWIAGDGVEDETCAKTNVPPKFSDIYLSFDKCEKRLNQSGSSLAAALLIHEALHHFGFGSTPEDESLISRIGLALIAALDHAEANRGTNWLFTPSNNRPDRRTDHIAVFTEGSSNPRMIIWGGCQGDRNVPYDCGKWLDSGSMLSFNSKVSSSQTWTAMNAQNAPEPRSLHTGIWTGTSGPLPQRMIVWGGCGIKENAYRCTNALQSGGLFNPDDGPNGTWIPTAVSNQTPSPRALHTSIWTGSSMIVWGGIQNYKSPTLNREAVNNGAIFTPNAQGGTWDPISGRSSNAPKSRFHHSAIWTGKEMIVWGGCSEELSTGKCDTYFNDGAAFNPMTGTWRTISPVNAPDPRRQHVAVWAPSIHRMIIFGGEFESDFLRTGGLYDPENDRWDELNYGGPPEINSSKGVWAGDHLIVFGGNGKAENGALTFPNDLWEYWPNRSPETHGQWIKIQTRDELAGRTGHSMIWTGSEALIWGGKSRDNTFQWTGGRIAGNAL